MSDHAEVLARYVSRDGELVWRIERQREADESIVISFGFENVPWHLHPELFAAKGRSPKQIADDVTTDLLADRLVILVGRRQGRYEIRLLDDLESAIASKTPDEEFELRVWSGAKLTLEELVDGVANVKMLDLNLEAKQ
jgi:hypothetical protein